MKDKVIDFISDLMSVILGIVITFAIQGMIDRSHDRKEVASALDLVRTERAERRVERGWLEDVRLRQVGDEYLVLRREPPPERAPQHALAAGDEHLHGTSPLRYAP